MRFVMNKKFALSAIAIFAVLLGMSSIAPVLAEGADPEQAADVNFDRFCSLNLGLSLSGLNEFGTATSTDEIDVHTNNANGNAMISCHGNLDDSSLAPDKAVKGTFSAGFDNPETGDFVPCDGIIIVTPSGKVSLTCMG